MPKLTKAIPKYRKHKASGKAVVTIAGRDHYLGRYGTKSSQREYNRLVGEWLAGNRMPPPEEPAELAVKDLILRFLGTREAVLQGSKATCGQAKRWGRTASPIAAIDPRALWRYSSFGVRAGLPQSPTQSHDQREGLVEKQHQRRSRTNMPHVSLGRQ